MKDFMKESYEVIEKKLMLAELTIELGQVTREKWARLETMRDILSREETLLKQIAETSKELQHDC